MKFSNPVNSLNSRLSNNLWNTFETKDRFFIHQFWMVKFEYPRLVKSNLNQGEDFHRPPLKMIALSMRMNGLGCQSYQIGHSRSGSLGISAKFTWIEQSITITWPLNSAFRGHSHVVWRVLKNMKPNVTKYARNHASYKIDSKYSQLAPKDRRLNFLVSSPPKHEKSSLLVS